MVAALHLCWLLAIASLATSQPVLLGSPLSYPIEHRCAGSDTVTLEVSNKRITIPGTQTSLNTRVYNGALPGPTIRMKAGETCKILLKNSLSTSSPAAKCNHFANNLHCPDTTNLHTHGLHVSPNGNSDNVALSVLPGQSQQYQYDLDHELQMGTHWYHAHRHGSATLHTGGGLAGALIVDPHDSYALPSQLKALYDKARVMALGGFDFKRGTNEFFLKSYPDFSAAFPDQTIDPNVSQGPNDPVNFYMVNGQYHPYATVTQGEVNVFRFVHISSGMSVEVLPLEPVDHGCQMQLLARDGVFQHTPYLNLTSIVMIPGTRADVAIRCPKPGVVNFGAKPQAINEHWMGRWIPVQNHPLTTRVDQDIIFQMKVVSATPAVRDFPVQEAPFPPYLSNLLNLKPDAQWHIFISGFNTVTPNHGFNVSIPTGVTDLKSFGINGKLWQGWENPVYEQTLCPDTLYSIILDEEHPYHQHINHFQVKFSDGHPDCVRQGEWRDTIFGTSPNNPPTELYLHTYRFTGPYVFHCHVQEHEDAGMMGAYNVLPTCGSAGVIVPTFLALTVLLGIMA